MGAISVEIEIAPGKVRTASIVPAQIAAVYPETDDTCGVNLSSGQTLKVMMSREAFLVRAGLESGLLTEQIPPAPSTEANPEIIREGEG